MKKLTLCPLASFTLIVLFSLFLFSCGDWKGFQNGFSSSGFFFEGSATLTWKPPSSNIDGTPVNDLGGYVIYFGESSGNYSNWVDVGNVLSYTVENLPSGTYYFAITSYDLGGNESELSNEMSKTIE
ncbi:MAG: hypothetical protein GTO02_06150 [Candidatus Dadabacteria bacterium]|nr:hypothetical protein [Candidatus Dadabacteria bacterium]